MASLAFVVFGKELLL